MIWPAELVWLWPDQLFALPPAAEICMLSRRSLDCAVGSQASPAGRYMYIVLAA